MLRTLLTFWWLRRLRRTHPEYFDSELAAASVEACVREG